MFGKIAAEQISNRIEACFLGFEIVDEGRQDRVPGPCASRRVADLGGQPLLRIVLRPAIDQIDQQAFPAKTRNRRRQRFILGSAKPALLSMASSSISPIGGCVAGAGLATGPARNARSSARAPGE